MHTLGKKVRGCLLFKFRKKVEFYALNFLVKTAKMHHLTEVQRGQIAILHKRGESLVDIARECGVSCKTVAYWVARDKAGNGFRDLPRRGRPRVTTPAVDKKIEKLCRGPKKFSAKKLAAASLRKLGRPVSCATITRRLCEQDVVSRMQIKIPKLRPGDYKIRLKYARKKLRDKYDWSRVAWHDEKTVWCEPRPRREWVKKGEQPSVVERSVHPDALQVWGCMGPRGFGPLCFFDGKMNGKRMAEYLKDSFCPSLESMVGPRESGWVSRHDNGTSYKAKTSRALLEDEGVRILDHPARSPDLNPIENVWSTVQYAVDAHAPTSKERYQALWLKEWKKLTEADAKKYCGVMKRRMKAIIKAKGGHIRQ